MNPLAGTFFCVLAAGLAVGCGPSGRGAKGGAQLEVEWSGADTGKVQAEPTAEWCDSLRLLEIRAIRGDTGIGLALYPRTRIEAGRYPIVAPGAADSSAPAAALALRWFGETSIRGFQGDSGLVTVRESPPGVYAGTIEAKARSVTDGGRLSLRGSFAGLVARPAARGCVSHRAAGDTGAGVH
jgi:hypothetical protein